MKCSLGISNFLEEISSNMQSSVQSTSIAQSCPTLCDPVNCSTPGNGTPLQSSCLENPMDGGAWWAAVHGVAKSRTRLSDLTFHFSLSCIGEGNGNPLQCSCLENPRDGGAWLAAVYGVAQSQTRLKRLSSSSSSSSSSRPPCPSPTPGAYSNSCPSSQ